MEAEIDSPVSASLEVRVRASAQHRMVDKKGVGVFFVVVGRRDGTNLASDSGGNERQFQPHNFGTVREAGESTGTSAIPPFILSLYRESKALHNSTAGPR